MATALYANNVGAVTAADIGPSDTLLILSSGQGAMFPSPGPDQYFWATLVHPVTFAVEIVQCTDRSANTLTIVRGRDGTAAIAFPAGSIIEMRLNAEQMREVNWRQVANAANGVLQLDAGGIAPKARLPSDLLYTVDGLVPTNKLQPEVLTETEGDARYGRLDQAETWAENQTFSKNVTVTGDVQIGVASGKLSIGDDASLQDVGAPGLLSIIGTVDDTIGGIGFGKGADCASLRWTGTQFTVSYKAGGPVPLWNGANFDPDTKVNRIDGQARSLRAYRTGFGDEQGLIYFGNGSAYINFDGANFSCSNNFYAPNIIGTSDEKLKKEIRSKPALRGIGDMIELVSWAWRRRLMKGAPAGRWSGVIAQAVKKFAPWHVTETADGTLGVDKAGLALEATVDNARRIRDLEATVAALQAQLKKIR